MPLKICKLNRSSRTTICRENFLTSLSKGYCASQKLHFYGYKLDAVCSSMGVFPNSELTQVANQHDYQKQTYLFRKTRKRIETLFSQFCGQLIIRKKLPKSFDGYKTRILTKITVVTVIQMINKLLNRNINNSKSLVV